MLQRITKNWVARATGFCLWIGAASLAQGQFQPFQPLPAQPPIPADNAMSPAKVELGKTLFFDPRLSANRQYSCNSCHNIGAAGTSHVATATTIDGKATRRTIPSLWNVGFYTIWFYDGSAKSLEEAVQRQLLDKEAMGMVDDKSVLARIAGVPDYGPQFAAVFGDHEAVSATNIAKAIAAYLRTLVTNDSPFDQYLRGHQTAIGDQAKRGMHTFIESGCASCHFYVNMAGPVPGLVFQPGEGFYELFPNHPGSEYDAKYHLLDDLGHYNVTHNDKDKRLWRVSSLRNVAATAPYFHNGSVSTLAEAIQVMAKAQLKKEFTTQEVEDVAAFLRTLTGQFPSQTLPVVPYVAGAVD